MKKLATIEWMKLKRSNTTKIILLVYAVIVPLMYWMLSLLSVGPIRIPIAGYQFPDAYQLTAWCASWLNLMVGVTIIVFTTNEIKFKTQRQNAIDGLRKVDIIISKFIVVVGMTLLVSFYTFLVAFVAGLINGGNYGPFDGIEYIGIYFISTLGYFIWAFFFAVLVRLPALAIIIYIFSTLIEAIVGLSVAQDFVQFFPLTTFARLSRFPMHFFIVETHNPVMMTTIQACLLAIFYIGLFTMGAFLMLKRRDI